MSQLFSWYAYCARYYARELWVAVPGRWWWLKALILLATLAIPGPVDEFVLFVLIPALRARRARRARLLLTEGQANLCRSRSRLPTSGRKSRRSTGKLPRPT